MRFFLSAAALGLALAACSPAAPPPANSTPTTPAASTPAAVEAPAAEPVALEITDASGAALSGDPAAGERVFRALCASCHSVAAGMNGTGPSLHNIVGSTAGQVEGFNYSQANRASGITWTHQELFTYLERPQARIPGTTMSFVGVPQPQRRADLIAYLTQQGG